MRSYEKNNDNKPAKLRKTINNINNNTTIITTYDKTTKPNNSKNPMITKPIIEVSLPKTSITATTID